MVCRQLRGNATSHSCVYHQWRYDLEGNLFGVPFLRGMNGQAGMPADFDRKGQRPAQAAGGELRRPGVRHLQRHGGALGRLHRPGDGRLYRPHLPQAGGVPRLHAAVLQLQLEALPGEREGPLSRQPAAPVPHHLQHLPGGDEGALRHRRRARDAQHHHGHQGRRRPKPPPPTRTRRSAPSTAASCWRTRASWPSSPSTRCWPPTTSSRSSPSW